MNQVKDFFEYIFNAVKIWIIVQPWEQCLIVRKGTNIRKVDGGMYFKIPYIDSIYVQETRLRMLTMSIQTLTTKDKATVTINTALGYTIVDLEKLFQTLCHPDGTLSNMSMSLVAETIYSNNLTDLSPSFIEKEVIDKLNKNDYGLKFEYLKITNFATVKTFRLIQDSQSWIANDLYLEKKK